MNIPKGVKTGIGLKHITPAYTSNFSTVSNPSRDESVRILIKIHTVHKKLEILGE